MMLSWKLWHALNHPPALHPLFWRTIRRQGPPSSQPGLTLWDKLALIYLVSFALLLLLTHIVDSSGTLSALSITLGCLAIPIIVPILILLRSTLLCGFFYGLLWADQMSRYLIREHQNHTYELLSLLPPGPMAPGWAICAGCLYQNRRFNRRLELHMVMLRFIAVGLIMFILLDVPPQFWPQCGLLLILLLSTLHIDFVHSLVVSTLISLLITRYSADALDARLWTLGSYLFVQVSTYTLALIAALVILPWPLAHTWHDLINHLAAGLLTLFIVREAVIHFIWRWLLYQANTAPDDTETIFKFVA